MERFQNFVVKGGIKLPIGYRFCPTDEELLIHYLKKKVFAQQLPASVISDFDVFQTQPWDLPGDLGEKRYFFSNRKGGNMNQISAGCGYWKWVGKEKQIVHSQSNEVIGMKKTLTFCKRSHGARTRWVMHELSLVTSYPCQMSMGDFAVYRIFQKKKRKRKSSLRKVSSSRKIGRGDDDVDGSFIDFTVEFGDDITEAPPPPPPSSPCLL